MVDVVFLCTIVAIIAAITIDDWSIRNKVSIFCVFCGKLVATISLAMVRRRPDRPLIGYCEKCFVLRVR